MTPEEFIRKYEDTHTELEALDALRDNKSLIKVHPEDKNITKYGKIPGKALIEAKAFDKRTEGFKHLIFDACGARLPDLMEMPVDKLFSQAAKLIPNQLEQKIEGNFTLVNMIQKAHIVYD